MTDKERQFIVNTVITLSDIVADGRMLLAENTIEQKPELETTGCPRCDIEQRVHNDPARFCERCKQQSERKEDA